jgi:hypothetical protein
MRSAKEVEAEQAAADERFEIGNDSDDDGQGHEDIDGSMRISQDPPPPYFADEHETLASGDGQEEDQEVGDAEAAGSTPPRTHIVRKGDTVRSLSLKHNLDVSCPILLKALTDPVLMRHMSSAI